MKNIYDSIILMLLFLFGSAALHAQCSTTGPRNGNSFSNNTGTGTLGWINPTNAITPNFIGSIATIIVDSSTTVTTNYLHVNNFGFSVPPTAIICGIEVEVKHKYQGIIEPNTAVVDDAVYLMNSGGITGPDHANPASWTNAYATTIYGGSSDNWGGSYTASDINLPSFGIAISANLISDSADVFLGANIDYVNIEVFYTIPLPTELINFNATPINNREVELNWSTESETNNDFFTVERSADGFNWDEIEVMDAAGNSNSLSNYSTTDKSPLTGNSYYRLMQTDFNGNHHYSDMVSVTIAPSNEIEIKYNPSTSSITIYGNQEEDIFATIYDCSGKEVKKQMIIANESSMIQVDDLVNGIYSVVVISSQQTVAKKFFISK